MKLDLETAEWLPSNRPEVTDGIVCGPNLIVIRYKNGLYFVNDMRRSKHQGKHDNLSLHEAQRIVDEVLNDI